MNGAIEQRTAVADSHPVPPPLSRYAAKRQASQQNLPPHPQSPPPTDGATLQPNDGVPLLEARRLETKDSHTIKVANWKRLFKPGDEFVLNGVTFVFEGIGKRCLHLKPKR